MHLKLTISCFNMIQIIIKPSQYFRSQTKIKIVLIDRETDYHTAPKIYLSFVFLFSFHREINEDASSDYCNLAPVALLLEYWCLNLPKVWSRREGHSSATQPSFSGEDRPVSLAPAGFHGAQDA